MMTTTSEEEFSSQTSISSSGTSIPSSKTSISSGEEVYKVSISSAGFAEPIREENEEPKIRGRQLIAEDPLWARCPVSDLSVICTHAIVENFIDIGPENVLKILGTKDRNEVMKLLPTDLLLELTVPLIDDNLYWERCCRARWKLCDVHQYDHSWKKMFIECHMEELIETFRPNESDPSAIEKNVQIFKNLVVRVNIKQLHILSEEKNQTIEFKTIGRDLSWKHLDVGSIFKNFSNLQEINLSYAPKNCGLKVDWNLFKFTDEDCLEFCGNLEHLVSLKTFHLYNSSVSDFQTELLISKFMSHSMLSKLDLSYNLIGNIGCQAVAKLLLSPCPLSTLSLCHNSFSEKGAVSIAAALTQNDKLKVLDLSLNRTGDRGGLVLFKSLEHNSTLEDLNISGSGLGKEAGLAFCKVIKKLNHLKKMDISANNLGVDVGKQLRISLADNDSVIYLNVRFCHFEEADEVRIGELIIRNSRELSDFHQSHSTLLDF